MTPSPVSTLAACLLQSKDFFTAKLFSGFLTFYLHQSHEEFNLHVSGLNHFYKQLLNKLFEPLPGNPIDLLRFLVKLALNYFCDNTCFQSYLEDLKTHYLSSQDLHIRSIIRLVFKEFLEEINSICVFECPKNSSEDLEERFSQRKFQTVTAFIQGSLLCISEVMQTVMGEFINEYMQDASKTTEE